MIWPKKWISPSQGWEANELQMYFRFVKGDSHKKGQKIKMLITTENKKSIETFSNSLKLFLELESKIPFDKIKEINSNGKYITGSLVVIPIPKIIPASIVHFLDKVL